MFAGLDLIEAQRDAELTIIFGQMALEAARNALGTDDDPGLAVAVSTLNQLRFASAGQSEISGVGPIDTFSFADFEELYAALLTTDAYAQAALESSKLIGRLDVTGYWDEASESFIDFAGDFISGLSPTIADDAIFLVPEVIEAIYDVLDEGFPPTPKRAAEIDQLLNSKLDAVSATTSVFSDENLSSLSDEAANYEVHGTNGVDLIRGSNEPDIIRAGGSNDIIVSGLSALFDEDTGEFLAFQGDTLEGGPGQDVFYDTPLAFHNDTIIGLEVGDSIFLEGEVVAQEDVSFDATTMTVDGTGGWFGFFEGDIQINAEVPDGATLVAEAWTGLDGNPGTRIWVKGEPKFFFTTLGQGTFQAFGAEDWATLNVDVDSRALTFNDAGNLVTAQGSSYAIREVVPEYSWGDFYPATQTTEVDPETGEIVSVERFGQNFGFNGALAGGGWTLDYIGGGDFITLGGGIYLALNRGQRPFENFNGVGFDLVGNIVGEATFIQNMPAQGFTQGIIDTAIAPNGTLYGIGPRAGGDDFIVFLDKVRSQPSNVAQQLYSDGAALPNNLNISAITTTSDGALIGFGARSGGSDNGIYLISPSSGDVEFLGDFYFYEGFIGFGAQLGDFVFDGTLDELRVFLGAEQPPEEEMSEAPSPLPVLTLNEASIEGDGGTLTGSFGNTRLVGSPGDDMITDLDGNNEVDADAGNDEVETGAGNDVVYGDEGSDTIRTGAGRDFADGGADDDDIETGEDDDIAMGGDGSDEIDAGTGSDDVYSGMGETDVVTLGDGRDRLIGTKDELIGDRVTDFTGEDEIVVTGSALSRTQIEVQTGSAILVLDEDMDGTPEGSISLDGDFSGGDFMAVQDTSNTVITFETFLPVLQERQAVDPDLVNGIINQNFLRGDGETDFLITLRDMGFAGYDNVLGVYEVDADGAILDPRILIANANADKSAQALIADVEDGHQLGFFLVQDAADWLVSIGGPDSAFLSFRNGDGAFATLADESDMRLYVADSPTDEIVFHSIDKALNFDGVEHALSGVEEGGMAITVGFEDLTGGGDRDYEDVVFLVEAIEADSFSFL